MANNEKVNAKAIIEKQVDEEKVKEVKTSEEEVKVVSRPKKVIQRRGAIKSKKHKVSYRKVVYVGTADKSIVKGAVTGNKYVFNKDKFKMPIAVEIDERDYPAMIALKGKGCVRKDPEALYITEQNWDLGIAEAKRTNS